MLNTIISIIPKLLLFLCLILIALAVKLNFDLTAKDNQIQKLENEQIIRSERLDRIEKQLEVIELGVEEARNSWLRLDGKVTEIEETNKSYKQDVGKVKKENETVKNLLDTKLPSDLQRLLNESIGNKE